MQVQVERRTPEDYVRLNVQLNLQTALDPRSRNFTFGPDGLENLKRYAECATELMRERSQAYQASCGGNEHKLTYHAATMRSILAKTAEFQGLVKSTEIDPQNKVRRILAFEAMFYLSASSEALQITFH